MKHLYIIITILLISITMVAQDSVIEKKPIIIEDNQIKQEIVNAYNVIIAANKDFQIAILKAKVKYKVPEDYEIDLNKMNFSPPKKDK